MRTPPFNRNRGGKPPDADAISTRCLIPLLIGSRSTMARRSLRDRRPRCRRPREACGDDRLSALPDDLLLLVLRRLDTRTALGTGLLSRRWAHLPHELPALDFRVGDILPPRYHRCILRHRAVMTSLFYSHAITKYLTPAIRRHERRATRAWVSSVKSFIDAADNGAADRSRRRKVSRLRLEFFITHHTDCINRLISKAIDDWGVEELEAVGKPMYWQRPPAHAFPSHGLCKEPRASRLRTLTLGGCVLPPLHEYGAITKLVLHGMADSTPATAYEGIFTSCPQLQVLHLEPGTKFRPSCRKFLVVDAPMSEIRELVVNDWQIGSVRLRSLPRLQSLASRDTLVLFESTSSCPGLRQWHLTYLYGLARKMGRSFDPDLTLETFFDCAPDITGLIVRFTGPERWIVPSSCSPLLPSLRRLLVADVPFSWDASWPRILLDAAPSLRILHIHITPRKEESGTVIPWYHPPLTLYSRLEEKEPGVEIPWNHPPIPLHNYHLEEFAMAGFQGTERQVYFVKLVVGACTVLRHVAIFKGGDVRYKGNWDWEMPRFQENTWNTKEKETMEKQIMDVASCSTDHLQIVLG